LGQQRVYNALTGEEVSNMILKEMKEEFTRDSDFRGHLTYNLVSWEWTLRMRATPQDRGPMVRKVQGNIEAVDVQTKEPLADPDDEVLVFEVSNTRAPIAVPDKARAGAGMNVPIPTPVPGVGVVDVPANRDRTEKIRTVEVRKDLQRPEGHMNPEAVEIVSADK